jgi:hypothetical protein
MPSEPDTRGDVLMVSSHSCANGETTEWRLWLGSPDQTLASLFSSDCISKSEAARLLLAKAAAS